MITAETLALIVKQATKEVWVMTDRSVSTRLDYVCPFTLIKLLDEKSQAERNAVSNRFHYD